MIGEDEVKTTQHGDESQYRVDDQKSNQHLVKSDTHVEKGLSILNLFDPTQLAAAENFLTKVMRSDKSGIKTVNDGLAILMRAQDFNLPFSACIEHIHVINGKTSIDIHIVKALLSRAGCTWRLIKDYQPLYEYTDGINVYIDGSFPDYVKQCVSAQEAQQKNNNSDNDFIYIYPVKWYQDFNGNIYKDYQLIPTKFSIIINKSQVQDIINSGKIPIYRIPNQPIDFITEYELCRTVNRKDIISIGHFSYSEAVVAGMFEKDTYKKYSRILIGHRAFTYAARDIASDILFGVMETSELKILSGKELNNIDIIDIDVEEVNT